jgi:hypothetical protein
LLDAARALSGGDPSSFNLRRWVKQPVGLFDREVLECPRLPSTTGDPVHIWANTVQGPASSSSLPSSSTINLHSLTRKLTFAPTSITQPVSNKLPSRCNSTSSLLPSPLWPPSHLPKGEWLENLEILHQPSNSIPVSSPSTLAPAALLPPVLPPQPLPPPAVLPPLAQLEAPSHTQPVLPLPTVSPPSAWSLLVVLLL